MRHTYDPLTAHRLKITGVRLYEFSSQFLSRWGRAMIISLWSFVLFFFTYFFFRFTISLGLQIRQCLHRFTHRFGFEVWCFLWQIVVIRLKNNRFTLFAFFLAEFIFFICCWTAFLSNRLTSWIIVYFYFGFQSCGFLLYPPYPILSTNHSNCRLRLQLKLFISIPLFRFLFRFWTN